jgi:hypothetical protein
MISQDPILSLCEKGDEQAISQLVKEYYLASRNLSLTDRERVREELPRNEIHDIACSAVYIWLGTFSLNYSAYFNLPEKERQGILLKIVGKACRRELLQEIGEHPYSKEPLRLEEDGSGTFATNYEGNKKFPLIDVLSENIEPIDFKDLSLDLDELTPKELWIVKDVFQGFSEGYEFSDKLGWSFRERWGKDYEKNIKAWNRVITKLKK